MKTILGNFSTQTYALMRIAVGFLFLCHGAQKLFGVLGGFGGQPGNTAQLFSLMGLAGVIETGWIRGVERKLPGGTDVHSGEVADCVVVFGVAEPSRARCLKRQAARK